MSEDERKIIADSAREAMVEQRKIAQAKESESIDNLRKTMQVNEITPAELTRLRQKIQPVIDKFSREVGDPADGRSQCRTRAHARQQVRH